MKKTVGIMTSEESFLNNYGAVLQGYALQKIVTELGYDCKIIRYKGYGKKRKFGWIKDIIKKILRIDNKNLLLKKQKSEKINDIIKRNEKNISLRTAKFLSFQNEKISFYSNERFTWETIKKNVPKFDIYICGSDQIWNPIFHGGICDRGYFLDFVPKAKKRIAYAPSLGTDFLPKSCKRQMKKLINKMSAVSVREKNGAELLSELMCRKIENVLDPTLLLSKDEWLKLSKMPNLYVKEYILCYRFSDNYNTLQTVKDISIKTGIPIISIPISPIAMDDPFINLYDVGPCEFIALINNAKLVCTDSFHATVFSFITDTPFLTFLRENYENKMNSMNSRIYSLLENLELTNRIVNKSDDIDYEKIFFADYSKGKKKILLEKQKSISFLKDNLGE